MHWPPYLTEESDFGAILKHGPLAAFGEGKCGLKLPPCWKKALEQPVEFSMPN